MPQRKPFSYRPCLMCGVVFREADETIGCECGESHILCAVCEHDLGGACPDEVRLAMELMDRKQPRPGPPSVPAPVDRKTGGRDRGLPGGPRVIF